MVEFIRYAWEEGHCRYSLGSRFHHGPAAFGVQTDQRQRSHRLRVYSPGHRIESLLGMDYNVLGIGGTAERKLSLHYTDFTAPMVKAMQEQQEIMEHQQAEISTMKARFAIIEAVLAGQP